MEARREKKLADKRELLSAAKADGDDSPDDKVSLNDSSSTA